jgi:hypothetical protein
MTCACKEPVPDRLEFTKCARGFLVSKSRDGFGMMSPLYAFDRVEDAAAWIVEQFAEKSA